METFADYLLNEKDLIAKMDILIRLQRLLKERKGITLFFNNSIILKTEIARMFMKYTDVGKEVDENLVLTACLLCNCKKIDGPQSLESLHSYAKMGAEFLASLGFDKRFCKICEEVNRYSGSEPREPESDILELVDQFTGLILRRAEREAFTPEEALIILKERNLKDTNNRYLGDFIIFVNAMENVFIRDNVDVPVIRKLAFLCERETSVKSYIADIGNRYSAEINQLININVKKESKVLFKTEEEGNVEVIKKVENRVTANRTRGKMQTVHRYTRVIHKKNIERALFSQEVADRVLNHKIDYKIVD